MARILVIDDDDNVRKVLKTMLNYSGFEVVEASNGAEGIALFLCKTPALVITDIFMPEMEGLETIHYLKRKYKGVKIIAITGGGVIAKKNYLSIADQLGADRCFIKPIYREELLKAVSDLV